MKVLEGKVSNEGRVVIPIDIRHSMGLAAGDRVQFVLADDGEVRLVTPRSLAHAVWARNTGGDAVDTGELVRAVHETSESRAEERGDPWDDAPSSLAVRGAQRRQRPVGAVPRRVSRLPTLVPTLVFDASALLAWVLQAQDQWRRVDRLFSSPAECVMPACALTEAIYIARERGNTSSPAQLRAALLAQGLRVESITEADAEWAGAAIAESRANPARWRTTRGTHREGTLSLGDGLTLAVAHRLGGHAVTFDAAWQFFPTLKFALVDPRQVPL